MNFDGVFDHTIVIGYVDHDRLIGFMVGPTVTLIIRVPTRNCKFSVSEAFFMGKTANV